MSCSLFIKDRSLVNILSRLSCETASEYHHSLVAWTVCDNGLKVKPALMALLLSLFDIPAYCGNCMTHGWMPIIPFSCRNLLSSIWLSLSFSTSYHGCRCLETAFVKPTCSAPMNSLVSAISSGCWTMNSYTRPLSIPFNFYLCILYYLIFLQVELKTADMIYFP